MHESPFRPQWFMTIWDSNESLFPSTYDPSNKASPDQILKEPSLAWGARTVDWGSIRKRRKHYVEV